MAVEKRECRVCKETKPLDGEHFHVDRLGKSGFRLDCKACRKVQELNRWHRNSEQGNAKRRKGKHKDLRRMCKKCRIAKPLNAKHWQAEKRKASGWRQPCKACLKKRKTAKIPLDEKAKP